MDSVSLYSLSQTPWWDYLFLHLTLAQRRSTSTTKQSRVSLNQKRKNISLHRLTRTIPDSNFVSVGCYNCTPIFPALSCCFYIKILLTICQIQQGSRLDHQDTRLAAARREDMARYLVNKKNLRPHQNSGT